MQLADRLMGQFDRNHNFNLNRDEFNKMMKALKENGMSGMSALDAWKAADLNHDGKVTMCELEQFLKKMFGMCGDEDQGQGQGQGGGCGGGGGGGGGCGGGGSPSGSGGCGGGEPYCPPCDPCPVPPDPCGGDDDAGGGKGCKTVERRGEMKDEMKDAAGCDGKMNRDEMGNFFDELNQDAEKAGSKSYITEEEKDHIFHDFDTNHDGYLDKKEQRKLRDELIGGKAPWDNKMTVNDWNKFNDKY